MAIICYSGLPGKGKTAMATYNAIKKYKKDNSLLSKLLYKTLYKITKNSRYSITYPINLIYSNYPILLNKKQNLYSHKVKLDDLKMCVKFPYYSMLIFDETQRYYDSREFKKFPKEIGTFMQHHRHATIDDIILITQHPRRIDNKMRDLNEIFRKYRLFIKIPFMPYIIATYTNYYEFEDYGKYHHVKAEMRTYDYDNHIKFLNVKNCFPRYNSKYFHFIFDNLPTIISHEFTNLDLNQNDLDDVGIEN